MTTPTQAQTQALWEDNGMMISTSDRTAVLEAAAPYLWDDIQERPALESPQATAKYIKAELAYEPHEVFCCLFLDTRHRPIAFEKLFFGTIDGATVYPRVVAQKALEHNAAAVIAAHNHPSGSYKPSSADQAITRRLKDALALLEIRLLDHFIVGDGEPVSMASMGMV